MSNAYCIRSDIEARYGVTNVATWGDLDNDDNADNITARITVAIAMAGDVIDDIFRGTHYRIPLADAAGSTPNSIADLAARYAGAWLQANRDWEDDNDKSKNAIAWVMEQLDQIATQKRRITAM